MYLFIKLFLYLSLLFTYVGIVVYLFTESTLKYAKFYAALLFTLLLTYELWFLITKENM